MAVDEEECELHVGLQHALRPYRSIQLFQNSNCLVTFLERHIIMILMSENNENKFLTN